MQTGTTFETVGVWMVMGTAVFALIYAYVLARDVLRHDTGSTEMRAIWKAIRDGGNTYLARQLRIVVVLVGLLAAALWGTAWFSAGYHSIAWGRAGAFLAGSLSSGLVGYLGMNMAMQGNIRVASA